jgi:mRNA-degrading endonuclease RelE of RelBE toxin-antitoxin system
VITLSRVEPSEKFRKSLEKAPPDVQKAARNALEYLLKNPNAKSLRLHRLTDYTPPIWKIDVFPNKSWQIVFELRGETAFLVHLASHKNIDRI